MMYLTHPSDSIHLSIHLSRCVAVALRGRMYVDMYIRSFFLPGKTTEASRWSSAGKWGGGVGVAWVSIWGVDYRGDKAKQVMLDIYLHVDIYACKVKYLHIHMTGAGVYANISRSPTRASERNASSVSRVVSEIIHPPAEQSPSPKKDGELRPSRSRGD